MNEYLPSIVSAVLTGAATYGALRVELRWMWAEVNRAHTEIKELRASVAALERAVPVPAVVPAPRARAAAG